MDWLLNGHGVVLYDSAFPRRRGEVSVTSRLAADGQIRHGAVQLRTSMSSISVCDTIGFGVVISLQESRAMPPAVFCSTAVVSRVATFQLDGLVELSSQTRARSQVDAASSWITWKRTRYGTPLESDNPMSMRIWVSTPLSSYHTPMPWNPRKPSTKTAYPWPVGTVSVR
jgi:hypothetical protein